MAFTSTVTERSIMGNKRVHWGTWTDNASGGGDIDTGLKSVDFITLQTSGASAGNEAAVNETLPLNGSDVTIACASDVDGYWMATGY